jgi:hypothetical protein
MMNLLKTKKSIANNQAGEEVKPVVGGRKAVEKQVEGSNRLPPALLAKKKIHKAKPKWNEEFVLIKVEPPVKTNEMIGGRKSRKRFSVRITYLDRTGAKHAKSVRFGDRNLKDFIDSNGDLKLRLSRNTQLSHAASDPFHKSFWRLNLLNNKPTLAESYNDLIKELGLI